MALVSSTVSGKKRAASAARSTPGGVQSPKKPTQERQRILPETRAEMLERLNNPQISLHEASVILRVCSATVRHYCNSGQLPHLRTPGRQRRFYLREVLAFLREREAEKRKK